MKLIFISGPSGSGKTTLSKQIILKIKDGIVHYAVTNMPGAVPNTSTNALTNATLNYALDLANKGWEKACKEWDELRENTEYAYDGCGYIAHYTATAPERMGPPLLTDQD